MSDLSPVAYFNAIGCAFALAMFLLVLSTYATPNPVWELELWIGRHVLDAVMRVMEWKGKRKGAK